MRKTLVVMMLAAFGTLTMAGCNTIKGAGKDVERGGEKIQSGAEKTQDKMKDNR